MTNLSVEQKKQLKQTIGITVPSTYEEVGDSIKMLEEHEKIQEPWMMEELTLPKPCHSSGLLVVAGKLFQCFFKKNEESFGLLKRIFPFKEKLIGLMMQFLHGRKGSNVFNEDEVLRMFLVKEKLKGLMMKFLYGKRGSDVIWVCIKVILSRF